MAQESPIKNWYRSLRQVTDDDRADFRIMLYDKKHKSDAMNAILGMRQNLLQNGFNADIIHLLLDATHKDNLPAVRFEGFSTAVFALIIFDESFRRDGALAEHVLDVLATYHTEAVSVLQTAFMMRGHILISGHPIHIKSTLIYRLIVVGADLNQAFDQSFH